MKRFPFFVKLSLILFALTLLFIFGAAYAESNDAARPTLDDFAADACQAYPDWKLRGMSYYGTGTWNDELANHVEAYLYRILDDWIELKRLHVVSNPLKVGDFIPWKETDFPSVFIKPNMAETLTQMTAEELLVYNYGAAIFTDAALPLLMPELTDSGEQLVELMVDSLGAVAITSSDAGERLKIAEWNGTEYSKIIATPSQSCSISFNSWHSSLYDIELFYSVETDEWKIVYIALAEDGTLKLVAVNTGWEIIYIYDDRIEDATFGDGYITNDIVHYGQPTFKTEMTELDLLTVPVTFEDMVKSLNASMWVCTAHDETPIFDAPNGNVIASCYTRVPATLLATEEEWVQLRIGNAQSGLTAWAYAKDLAFGAETENVVCSFPNYEATLVDYATALDGRSVLLDDPWLIGKTPDGQWLTLLCRELGRENEVGAVCIVPADTFSNIGPTVHESDGF